jgi:hypothetical protein
MAEEAVTTNSLSPFNLHPFTARTGTSARAVLSLGLFWLVARENHSVRNVDSRSHDGSWLVQPARPETGEWRTRIASSSSKELLRASRQLSIFSGDAYGRLRARTLQDAICFPDDSSRGPRWNRFAYHATASVEGVFRMRDDCSTAWVAWSMRVTSFNSQGAPLWRLDRRELYHALVILMIKWPGLSF